MNEKYVQHKPSMLGQRCHLLRVGEASTRFEVDAVRDRREVVAEVEMVMEMPVSRSGLGWKCM